MEFSGGKPQTDFLTARGKEATFARMPKREEKKEGQGMGGGGG